MRNTLEVSLLSAVFVGLLLLMSFLCDVYGLQSETILKMNIGWSLIYFGSLRLMIGIHLKREKNG